MGGEKRTGSIPCTCMDLVEIAQRDRVYPVMYCRMVLQGHLDLERLKRAVEISAGYVPELLYSVDFESGRFVDRHFTADRVFCKAGDGSRRNSGWDLSADVQLKLAVKPEGHRERLTIGMSHILTDGSGFLQYLYLLSSIYNGKEAGKLVKNERDIKSILRGVPFFFPRGRDALKRAVCAGEGEEYNCQKQKYSICRRIESTDFAGISRKAAFLGVSINDVLMAAYFRVVLRRLGGGRVSIPCPADLRKLNPATFSGKLTVGNMTGLYRGVCIPAMEGGSFDTVLRRVHEAMGRQRAGRRCFQGLRLLRLAYGKIPVSFLMEIIRKNYEICPVSYTNFGEIDSARLHFAGCRVLSCYLTGTYRRAPDFQLSVSTFKDVCTLNCALWGTRQRKEEGESILEGIRKELLDWLGDA